MKLLAQIPEQPINETWQWLTDKFVSSNGTEQRVCNSDLPKQGFGVALQFDNANDLRSHVASMFIGAKGPFQVPLYQYGTRLQASGGIGTDTLAIASVRTELRTAGQCLVYDKSGYELHTVNALTDSSVTLNTGLARLFRTNASICPVVTAYAPNNSSVVYGIVDSDAKASLNLSMTQFTNPFLNPYITETLTTLDGLPVLEEQPIGGEFNDGFDTGIDPRDEGGVVDIRSPWVHAQIVMQRSFLCQRFMDRAGWNRWRVFADTVKGSWKAFYMPSYRQDFDVTVQPAAGGNSLRFTGRSYNDDWFPYAPFKGVAIFHAGGVHYAKVTASAVVGGNSQITFTPNLPGDAGAIERISILLKLRIHDDKIALQHFPLYSVLTISLRTVDA